jgi:hypothetical protein
MDLPFCKVLGEFIDTLSSSELLEKLPLQENEYDDLQNSRLDVTNIDRC